MEETDTVAFLSVNIMTFLNYQDKLSKLWCSLTGVMFVVQEIPKSVGRALPRYQN